MQGLRRVTINLCLTLASTLVFLFVLEGAARTYHALRRSSTPLHIIVNSPVLYGLNPMYPGISSQGLRDDDFSLPKPKGKHRILILGDSVPFGPGVPKERTFPKLLQAMLRTQFGSLDVINGGVSGYSPYNELQFYLTFGRRLEPDIVIIAFCMNDVADPRLHWMSTSGTTLDSIPQEAIPNLRYDREVIIPRMQQLDAIRRPPILRYSELYGLLEKRVEGILPLTVRSRAYLEAQIPTYVTGEDTLNIRVLLEDSSPEWKWLTSTYDRLHAEVMKDGAVLIVAIFPLAFQLDEDYPFNPQTRIAEYCSRNSILWIDMLQVLRRYKKEDVFRLRSSDYFDVWHLTEVGHELTAQSLYDFLKRGKLLERSANQPDDPSGNRPPT
jgi:hypothetical protein